MPVLAVVEVDVRVARPRLVVAVVVRKLCRDAVEPTTKFAHPIVPCTAIDVVHIAPWRGGDGGGGGGGGIGIGICAWMHGAHAVNLARDDCRVSVEHNVGGAVCDPGRKP